MLLKASLIVLIREGVTGFASDTLEGQQREGLGLVSWKLNSADCVWCWGCRRCRRPCWHCTLCSRLPGSWGELPGRRLRPPAILPCASRHALGQTEGQACAPPRSRKVMAWGTDMGPGCSRHYCSVHLASSKCSGLTSHSFPGNRPVATQSSLQAGCSDARVTSLGISNCQQLLVPEAPWSGLGSHPWPCPPPEQRCSQRCG